MNEDDERVMKMLKEIRELIETIDVLEGFVSYNPDIQKITDVCYTMLQHKIKKMVKTEKL